MTHPATDAAIVDDEAVATYRRDGFVLGGPLLDADRVEELRDELDRVAAAAGTDAPQPVHIANLSVDPSTPVWQIVDIWTVSAAFERLLHEPKLADDAARLTGADELRVWHDQIQHKPPTTGGSNHWHQDLPYWPVLEGGHQVTGWIALDDADEENGAMVMVPRSHQWGDQIAWLGTVEGIAGMPAEFDGHDLSVVSRPVRAGEVHYHHSLTWHGSPGNRSGRHRRAIAVHLMSGDTRFRAAGHHVMKQHITSADGDPVRGDLFPQVHPRPA